MFDGFHLVLHSAPVGDDHAFIPPLSAKHILKQIGRFRCIVAVQTVVAAHDHPGVRFFDDFKERMKIHLVHRPFIDLDVDETTHCLLFVESVMLDACTDLLRLDALDETFADLCRQMWVLAIILEVASAKRAALEIDAGPEEHVDLVMPALPSDCAAHFLDQVPIPGGRHRGGAGKKGRRLQIAFAQEVSVIHGLSIHPHPMRSVCHVDSAPIHMVAFKEMPIGLAARQSDFLFQRNLFHLNASHI